MAKERREKELPKGKPRGRVKRSSSTRSQRNIPHSRARSLSIQPVDWEQRYRALFDRSLQYVIIQDFEGNILDANERVLKLLGYDREDIPHLNIASLLSEDQLPKASAALQELKDTGMTNQVNEWRLRRKDGSFIDMLLSGALIYHEGKPHAILGIGINITEHKRAEESLRLSEQNFRDSIEKSPLGIRIVTEDGTTLYVNKTLLDICGYGSLEELKAVPRNQLYTPESYSEHRKRVNKRKRRKYVPSNYEISIVRKDGQVRRLSVSRGEVLWDGEKQSQVVYQDITEHKQAEEMLRRSEEKYRTILEEMGDGYFETDLAGNLTFVNDAMIRVLGYSKEEIIGMNYRALRPKEEAKAVFKAYNHVYKTGEPLRNLFTEIICKDGRHVLAETSAFPIRNDKGEIIGFRGVRRDITERKKAEEALRQSEERYRTMLEEMEEGYYEVDLAGTFTFVNDAMCRILGYSRDELIGMNYKIYTPKEDVKAISKAYNRVYRTSEPLKWCPMPEFRKDGTRIVAEDSVFPLRNEKGEVIGFRGISRDVTERRKTEERLKESEQKYRLLFETSLDYIVQMDREGRYLAANPATAKSLGVPLDELVGKTIFEVQPQEVAQRRLEMVRKALDEWQPQIFEDERAGRYFNHIYIPTKISDQKEAVQMIARDITERRKMEEALRQSEENYKTLFNSAVIGMYVLDVETMKVVMGNRAAAEMAGFSSVGEGIGINPLDFVIPEDREQVLEIAGKEFEQDLRQTHEVRVGAKDGGIGWISISSARIMHEGRLAALVSITDITERKKMEEALRQSEERYRDILEKMEDSYFEVDLAGNLTFINSAACRHLGYSKEELIRMSYKDFTDGDYIQSVFRIFNEVYRTGVPNKGFPWKVIREDGSPGFIDASVTPLRNDKGKLIGFSGVGRDVTERRKMEEQLILTDRLASIGQLAAGIAHELNNPLTGVIGFSDLLLERDLPADVKSDLVTINQEAMRAINIVKGLLAFAREQRIEKSPTDINSIIQGVLQLRSYEQRVSNIEVDARFASALPPVMGNGAQLQQVFINIIINAEQAMIEAHGKGKLTIATERVGDIVRASITDDGPGISPDNMKKLFIPFFTTREVGKGTGLGLSICHGIVTEHGGKIYAESELGKGATFVIELPISK
jgi:PAS domain S-box-containing protein